MPFLFRDADHVRATVASKPGDALTAKLDGEGFVVGDYVNYCARHLLAKEPLTRPGDLAGKRLRVIQSPLHATLWESFGAVPVPVGLPITETYNALATGVVDAMDLTMSAYAGFQALRGRARCDRDRPHLGVRRDPLCQTLGTA
jgi:TRAP-type transport system periplasmic protein